MGYRGYGYSSSYGSQWAPYVSVGQRLAMAKKEAAKIAKKQKREPSPVCVNGRIIAKSFWGKAWCDNLNAYSDFSNRLPRGATYVRNGSVVDLVITAGKIEAMVAGSEPYEVSISIKKLASATWKKIKHNCSSSIDSLFDLLAGRLSDGVMQGLTNKSDGCFPTPREIDMECSCPDYSYCCKHLAAVMYGVGNRLDSQPELLFLMRGVDHAELISAAVSKDNLNRELVSSSDSSIAESDLSEIFGIELDNSTSTQGTPLSVKSSKPSKTSKPISSGKATIKTKNKTKATATKTPSVATPSKIKKPAQRMATKVVVKKARATRDTSSEKVSPSVAKKTKTVSIKTVVGKSAAKKRKASPTKEAMIVVESQTQRKSKTTKKVSSSVIKASNKKAKPK